MDEFLSMAVTRCVLL